MTRVRVTIVAAEQWYYIFCVCVCVCVLSDFPPLCYTMRDFWKRAIEHKIYVFIFSKNASENF